MAALCMVNVLNCYLDIKMLNEYSFLQWFQLYLFLMCTQVADNAQLC